MAWIVKNSGTQQIDRRAEPYLTDQMQAELREKYLPRFPTKQAATLPALHLVQHRWNWIPYQAIEEVAAFLELKPADVYDTATFYEEFFLEPKGRYLVQICQSIACELCGHETLADRFKARYDIEDMETTDDGRFTLMMVECIGACGGAPAVLINGRLYEHVSWEQLEQTLDGLPDDPAAFESH
jgi:NADH-quinone oxidoreductase subunit E